MGGLGSFIQIPYKDKIAHFVFYFLFYVLWRKYLNRYNPQNKLKFALVLIGIGYGMLMEVLQHFSGHHRSADWFDVIANSIGALIGYYFFERFLVNKKKF